MADESWDYGSKFRLGPSHWCRPRRRSGYAPVHKAIGLTDAPALLPWLPPAGAGRKYPSYGGERSFPGSIYSCAVWKRPCSRLRHSCQRRRSRLSASVCTVSFPTSRLLAWFSVQPLMINLLFYQAPFLKREYLLAPGLLCPLLPLFPLFPLGEAQ